jgi:hypothetical protein
MTIHRRWSAYPVSISRLSGGLQQDQAYNETNLANGFIQRSSSPAEAPYTYKLQLEARARDNVPDTRDDGPAERYFIKERAIVETMGIGLTSADMTIPEMLGDG